MTLAHRSTFDAYLGLFVVSLGASLATMDVAVNVAFPAITAAFALDTRAIRWVVVYYVVTYACLTLAFGRLGDAIGHRRVFRAGLFVALGGYLGCALAPSYQTLLLARVVQGVSTALLLSCAPALCTQLFDETRRTHALGTHAAMTSVAATFAPVLGGLCIAWMDWSGVFWMRMPFVAIALALLHRLPKLDHTSQAADRFGLASLAAAIALLLLAPSTLDGDGSLLVPAAFLAGGSASLTAFIVQQKRTAMPFFPRGTARVPGFVFHNLANGVLQFAAFGVPLVVPYYLSKVAGYGPEGIGGALVLLPVGMLIGSSVAPRLARRFGTRTGALVAILCLHLGTLAIAAWSTAPLRSQVLGALLLNGFGLGLFQVVYTDLVVVSLPHGSRGVAGSLTMVTRTIGVVTAASALTAALAALEAQAMLATPDDRSAYAAAFSRLFGMLALLPASIFVLGCLRPHFFRSPEASDADT